MYVRPDLYYSQTIEHLSNWYSCRALDLALYSAWRSRMLNLLREAFFWFPSTQGRENGRVGDKNVKPQVNAAPKRWTTKTDQKSPVQKESNSRPRTLETNRRANGNQKKASLRWVLLRESLGCCELLSHSMTCPTSRTLLRAFTSSVYIRWL